MQNRKRYPWQFSMRALFIGVTAAAVVIAAMSAFGITGDFVIIALAVVAVLLEAAIHRRGLRWVSRIGERRPGSDREQN